LRLPLREKIKAIELEAERALMTRLAGLEGGVKFDINQGIRPVVLVNLCAVSQAWGRGVPESGLSRLLEALSDGRFLQYNP
jgi:hypothetical protein